MEIKDVQKVIVDKVTGVWTPKHDEKGHHYMHLNGTVVDSVTTKIIIDKPHLIPWAARLAVESFIKNMEFYDANDEEGAARIVKEAIFAHQGNKTDAGAIGTIAHEIVENYMNSWIKLGVRPKDIVKQFVPKEIDGLPTDPRVFAAVRSMEKFFKENPDVKPIASEMLVGDLKLKIAGTLDLLVMWGDKLWLLDLKTSNSALHDDYAMQVSMYKYAFQRMTGLKIHGLTIIGVSKSYDSYGVYDVLTPHKAAQAFKGIAKAYDWQRNKEPKLLERKNRITI